MHQILKLFFLIAFLLVALFFANYYGYISVPWLEFNSVPTYGSGAKAADDAVKQEIEDGIVNKP